MRKEKNYFASANTGKNFTNYFNYINDDNEKGFQFILKGGPGTGKSTLLKKVGQYFANKDLEVEYFWCSSDIDSLDGVRIPEYNISVIDGTAPHSFDASFPSIKQKIVDLGECIGIGVKSHEEEIFADLKQKSNYFDIAYNYLNSALSIYKINQIILEKNVTKSYINKKINNIIKKINLNKENNIGNDRKLFLKAVSQEEINLENLNNYNSVIELELDAFELPIILKGLVEKINELGYDTISFYNNIEPDHRESIFIPKLNIFIKNKLIINKKIEKNNELINDLIKNAGINLLSAKTHHKNVEKYYIENMDFNGLNFITNKLIINIENMSKLNK